MTLNLLTVSRVLHLSQTSLSKETITKWNMACLALNSFTTWIRKISFLPKTHLLTQKESFLWKNSKTSSRTRFISSFSCSRLKWKSYKKYETKKQHVIWNGQETPLCQLIVILPVRRATQQSGLLIKIHVLQVQMNIWKIIYLNCDEGYEFMMIVAVRHTT